MIMELNCTLNRENKEYTYLENVSVKTTAQNLSEKTINVFEVFIKFKNNNGIKKFEQKCDVEIKPNEAGDLPSVNFIIGLWAGKWSNFFKVGIVYREKMNNRWSKPMTYMKDSDDYLKVINAPSRSKKIFISHSNFKRDRNIVSKLNDFLIKIGFTPYIAERDAQPGRHLWEKIHKELVECERIIVLHTEDGIKSGDIREEIGIAIGLGKKDKIIPVVEAGFLPPGSLLGTEYITLDFKKIDVAILKTANDALDKGKPNMEEVDRLVNQEKKVCK